MGVKLWSKLNLGSQCFHQASFLRGTSRNQITFLKCGTRMKDVFEAFLWLVLQPDFWVVWSLLRSLG